MTTFMVIRDRIREFVSKHEIVIRRIWHGIIMITALACLMRDFPIDGPLQSPVLAVVLSLLGAFLPMSGCSLILIIFCLLHLIVISPGAALIAAVLFLIAYLITVYYQSKERYYLVALPVLESIRIPYAGAVVAALTGSVNDVASVISGGFMAYFLHTLHSNIALIEDGNSLTAFNLLMSSMFQNRMFYFYMIALVSTFLLIYVIRIQNIRFSWILANVVGIAACFSIMLAGLLFTGSTSSIGALLLSCLIVLAIGIILTYFIMDLDYSQAQNVQFEDDDYYYYVTAVPKIRLTREEKKVKRITGSNKRRE